MACFTEFCAVICGMRACRSGRKFLLVYDSCMGRMTGRRTRLAILGLTLGAMLALGQPLSAQGFQEFGPYATGWGDVNLPHQDGPIRVRLVYPSQTGGPGATPDVANGPFPMLFFGHGLGGPEHGSVGLHAFLHFQTQIRSWDRAFGVAQTVETSEGLFDLIFRRLRDRGRRIDNLTGADCRGTA